MLTCFRKYSIDAPVEVTLVGSEPKNYDNCMHCLSDQNWWCFRSRKAWLILECATSCVPCAAVTVRATNKTGCPSWVAVEALESYSTSPTVLLAAEEAASNLSEQCKSGTPTSSDVSNRWSVVVSKQPLCQLAASDDSTFTLRFPEELASRYWKITLGQESGGSGWMGINRIRLMRSRLGIFPIIHPKQAKLRELLDQIIDGERDPLELEPGTVPGAITLIGSNTFALYGTPASRCCEGLKDAGVAVALEREGFKGRVVAFSHNNFCESWQGLGPRNRVRAKVFFAAVAWAAGVSRAIEGAAAGPLEAANFPETATHSNPSSEVPTGSNPSSEVPTGSNPSSEVPTGSNPSSEVPTGSNPSTETPRHWSSIRAVFSRVCSVTKATVSTNGLNMLHAASGPPIRVALLGGIAGHAAHFPVLAAQACPKAPPMQVVAAQSVVDLRFFQSVLSPNSTKPRPHVVILCHARASELIADASDKRVQLLADFIGSHGGGFVVALCPWGWSQLAGPGVSLNQCLPNHVVSIAGLVFNDQTLKSPSSLTPVTNLCGSLARLTSDADSCDCTALQTAGAVVTCILGTRLNWLLPLETVTSLSGLVSHCTSECIWQLLNCLTLKDVIDFSDAVTRGLISNENRLLPSTVAHAISETLTLSSSRDSLKLFPIKLSTFEHKHHDARPNSPPISWVEIRETQSLQRILLGCLEYSNCRVDSCPKAIGIEQFPGHPVFEGQTQKHWEFQIDLATKGWQFSGCYAPPGVRCSIRLLLSKQAKYNKLRMRIQVGSHTDKLEIPSRHGGVLRRWPEITVSCIWEPWLVDPTGITGAELRLRDCRHGVTTEFASPYGGLIYLEVLNGGNQTGSLGFMLEATHLAPAIHYKVSSTGRKLDPSAWRASLQAASRSPWGEIEGRHIIFTLPYTCLELIQDPNPVINFWDEVVSHHLELSGDKLQRKERIVCDEQLSSGYMHSGYPIGVQLDQCRRTSNGGLPPLIDLDRLRQQGSWGVFHELGHNRQSVYWTFSGASEVTVNLFSLHACFKILGQTPFNAAWFKAYIPLCLKYLEDKKETFQDSWCTKPGVALGTYACYIERYGFGAVRKILYAYHGLQKNLNTETLKITEWVIQSSAAVSIDLRPYYDQWKWPYDKAAVKEACGRYKVDNYWNMLIDILRAAAPSG